MSRALGPSLTYWNRLEPSTRDPTLDLGLQAQAADPLWMLARQWQLGEFAGDDSGSPVQCSWLVESLPVTGLRAGPAGGPISPLAPGGPVSAQLQAEPLSLGLKGAVQLGLYFENLLTAASTGAGATIPPGLLPGVLAWFRSQYPIGATRTSSEAADAAGDDYRTLVTGRVTNGVSLMADPNAPDPVWLSHQLPVSVAAAANGASAAAAQLVAYFESLYASPPTGSCWDSLNLRYAFSIGESSAHDPLELDGSGFTGGDLDWFSFDLASGSTARFPAATPTEASFAAIPVHATFRGMPNARWWTFDDRASDLGQLVVDQTDLVKLLIMEFANVCGNEWFQLPVQLPAGTLSRVSCLLVTDTFGVATAIESANPDTASAAGPWSMFTLSDGTDRSDLLLLLPAAGPVLESPALEQVNVLRDDGALMAWAVERTIPGPLDQGIDAFESYVQAIGQLPPSPDPTPSGGAAIAYLLEKPVPYNWIPFVPQQYGPAGAAGVFRRGAMVRFDAPSSTWVPVPPMGLVLQPDGPAASHPMIIRPESVPRVGTDIGRFYRRSRGPDGATIVWIGRRIKPGRGPGNSGLAFDGVVPPPGAGST